MLRLAKDFISVSSLVCNVGASDVATSNRADQRGAVDGCPVGGGCVDGCPVDSGSVDGRNLAWHEEVRSTRMG